MDSTTTVPPRLRAVFVGSDDPRLRATWRFVLAWPLLPVVGAVVALIMPVLGVSGMIPGGPLQGLVMLVLLVLWARYIDRRPLSDYGVSASPSWGLQLLIGFVAVVGVWSGWHTLAASLGWMEVESAIAGLHAALLFGLVGRLVSLAINTWVQDVVFFAIVVASAAQGFRSRNATPRQAVLAAWGVGVLFFTTIHGTPTVLDAVATAVGGAVFGALYVQTGELALPIGVHWGASYAAGTIFVSPTVASQAPAIFAVTKALPGGVGGGARILLYVATYVVIVGWLRLARGGVDIETGLAEWTPRTA